MIMTTLPLPICPCLRMLLFFNVNLIIKLSFQWSLRLWVKIFMLLLCRRRLRNQSHPHTHESRLFHPRNPCCPLHPFLTIHLALTICSCSLMQLSYMNLMQKKNDLWLWLWETHVWKLFHPRNPNVPALLSFPPLKTIFLCHQRQREPTKMKESLKNPTPRGKGSTLVWFGKWVLTHHPTCPPNSEIRSMSFTVQI